MNQKITFCFFCIALLALNACKKTDPLPLFEDVNAFYGKNKSLGTNYTVNTDGHADTLSLDANTQIIFPEGAFDKSGDVTLNILTISNPAELVLTNNPNRIDSNFNQTPLIFEINSESSLASGKTFRISTANFGFQYPNISFKQGSNWVKDASVSTTSTTPTAGDAPTIFNTNSHSTFTYNRFGQFSLTRDPFLNMKGKTKTKIKIYGFTNTNQLNTYVILKGKNAVSLAKRLNDSEFVTDSILVGSEAQFISICYNQNKKYVGFANGYIADSVNVPISLSLVSGESEITEKVKNYLK